MKSDVIDLPRRIASTEHNRFVAEGMNQHQATQVAPSSLLQSFDEDLVSRIESRHRGVSELLESVLGKPYFSDTGFFLYQGNCAEFLERLRTSGIGADLALTS